MHIQDQKTIESLWQSEFILREIHQENRDQDKAKYIKIVDRLDYVIALQFMFHRNLTNLKGLIRNGKNKEAQELIDKTLKEIL